MIEYDVYKEFNYDSIYKVEDQGPTGLCQTYSFEDNTCFDYFKKTGKYLNLDERAIGRFVSEYYGYHPTYIEQNGFDTLKVIKCFQKEYIPGTKMKVVNFHPIAHNVDSIKDTLRQLKQPILFVSKGMSVMSVYNTDTREFEWKWVKGKFMHSMLIYKYVNNETGHYIMCKNWDDVKHDIRVDIDTLFDEMQIWLRSLYIFNIQIHD